MAKSKEGVGVVGMWRGRVGQKRKGKNDNKRQKGLKRKRVLEKNPRRMFQLSSSKMEGSVWKNNRLDDAL